MEEKPVACADVLLNRFLYMSETESAYVPGDPFIHQYKSPEIIYDLILQLQNTKKHDLIEAMFKKYLTSGKTSNNTNAIFVLSICCRRGDIKLSSLGYKLMPSICKISEDMMLFVKFMADTAADPKKGFGKGMRKAISKWYLSFETPMELAKAVGLCRSKYGRSHKDIITLSHTKATDSNINAILAYAVHGYNGAKEKMSSVEGVLESPSFVYLTDLHDFKSCDDPEKAAKCIEVHHFPVTLTPVHMIKSRQIWEAAVNNFSLKDTMFYLHRLHNMGYLTPSNVNSKKILPKVLSYLKDKNLMQRAKLHPLQVYILLKNYENGGKPLKYPKSEHKKKSMENPDYRPADPPTPAIINALKSMVEFSMTTHNATGARFMITLDMRSHMFEGKCSQCPNVSPGIAGVILALALVKREREVTVAVFTDRGIQPVGLNKDFTLEQAVDKLKGVKAGHVRMSKPMEWCTLKKKRIDVFINVMESPLSLFSGVPAELRDRNCVIEEVVKYRSRMNLPNCKLVSMFLARHNPAIGRNYMGCIDFGGLDEHVPKIIEHFAKSNFR